MAWIPLFWARRLGTIGLLAVALGGCASPNPDLYTLAAVPGTVVVSSAETIELRRPGLAGYLDRSDIVLKQSDYRLSVNSQLRWAEPIGDMIGRVLSEDIGQRLPGSAVFGQSGAITADPALRIEIDVQRFDLGADGQVTLLAELAIEAGREHTALRTRQVSLQAAPAGPGAAELAAAMSALLGRLADQVAVDVRAVSGPKGKKGVLF